MDMVRVSVINASAVKDVQDTTRDLLDYSPRTIGA